MDWITIGNLSLAAATAVATIVLAGATIYLGRKTADIYRATQAQFELAKEIKNLAEQQSKETERRIEAARQDLMRALENQHKESMEAAIAHIAASSISRNSDPSWIRASLPKMIDVVRGALKP